MHGTPDLARNSELKAARDKAYSTPLADFNPGDPDPFRNDTFWPYFERRAKKTRSTTARTASSARTGPS